MGIGAKTDESRVKNGRLLSNLQDILPVAQGVF
jgi:hypothetical protein